MTEQQEKFLNALFGEAQGNFREAMSIAGYAPTEYPARLIRQMKNEIIERAEYMLAANAPKAVLSMSGILDDPSALGNRDNWPLLRRSWTGPVWLRQKRSNTGQPVRRLFFCLR
jgi:hypothetical protein